MSTMKPLPRFLCLSGLAPLLRGPTLTLACALATLTCPPSWAADPQPAVASKAAASTPTAKEIGEQIRSALQNGNPGTKTLPLTIEGKGNKLVPGPVLTQPAEVRTKARPRPAPQPAITPQQIEQQYIRARTLALTGRLPPSPPPTDNEVFHDEHWSYEGRTGPHAWGKLKPEFSLCANGNRQSPIPIEDAITLKGPADPIVFNYQPSKGVVINNGHTIQVDVTGDNTITTRDTTFKLVQFHFHHPSEEQINQKTFPLVAHLVHRNEQGQLAVVAVLFNTGTANSLIHKVWTYLPLDANDKVRMPEGLINLSELLPRDQRYYQFIGSLTTPPCTEGVLWMIFKQPITVSEEQLKLFGQLFPNNARPVQPVNERPIREAISLK